MANSSFFARIRRLTWAHAKVRLRDAHRNAWDAAVFNTIGYALNRLPFFYMLSHRPDFHADFGRAEQYSAAWSSWIRGNHANNIGDLPRFYMLLLNVAKVLKEGIPGDMIELGVYKGNSAAFLARAARAYGRQLYLSIRSRVSMNVIFEKLVWG